MAAPLRETPRGWDYRARLVEVGARVHAAEVVSGRAGAGVRVLVATKGWSPTAAAAVRAAGATLIGESRMQELAAKAEALAGARIHVIGPLQRNKAATAVALSQCIETVDSAALAERLSRLALEAERNVDVMIQVNVSGEDSKAGVSPREALDVATRVQALGGLTVKGFMTIGLNSTDERRVRSGYRALREIRDEALILAERGAIDLREAWELSMGMSNDLEWAIGEGATIVRVGTAVMGRR